MNEKEKYNIIEKIDKKIVKKYKEIEELEMTKKALESYETQNIM